MANNEQQEEKEMNIFQAMNRVFRAIGNFFLSILSGFGKLAQLAYKYKYLFLTFVALIVATTFFMRRDKAKVYQAEMHIQINDGDRFIYENLIKTLNDYTRRNDVEGLANILNTSSEVAGKINEFETFNVIDIHKDSTIDFIDYKNDIKFGDTMNVILNDHIVVRAKISSTDICEELQKSILYYFTNNNYLTSLNIARLASLEEQEWMFHNALLNLDSLQKVDYFKKELKTVAEFSPVFSDKPMLAAKRQMYYNDMKKLFKINQDIAVDLSANLDVVTVVSDLQPIYKLSNPTYKIVLLCGGIGLLIFFLIAAILEYRERMVKYLENKEK